MTQNESPSPEGLFRAQNKTLTTDKGSTMNDIDTYRVPVGKGVLWQAEEYAQGVRFCRRARTREGAVRKLTRDIEHVQRTGRDSLYQRHRAFRSDKLPWLETFARRVAALLVVEA